ncbi:MAG: hypothetical protein ABSB60_04190 [Terracidiphilus sp.]|jgi:hypothetical protein
MHLGGGSIQHNPVNPYNAATEKTFAAKRSYQIRKKLTKRASGAQGWAGVDQTAIIGRWMSGGHGLSSTKNQPQPVATRSD